MQMRYEKNCDIQQMHRCISEIIKHADAQLCIFWNTDRKLSVDLCYW